jgi:DNA adenine methylase
MNTASPLRYPGGKASMAGLIAEIRRINRLGDRAMAEPFAGGAGASLSLLYREETPEVFINDADPAIHDFWWSVTARSDEFGKRLRRARVNMAEWRRQRVTYRATARISRVRRGFAAFYLNRCNRSGIIMNGGPIGGIQQQGTWKLGARFNKGELLSRCARIAEYQSRIHISGVDGLAFIERANSRETFYFIDPPYFHKGNTLYLNALDEEYHASLGRRLKGMADAAWIVTYDDCPEIRRIYRGWARIRPFSLRYVANQRRQGSEILIVPNWMQLPKAQSSDAIDW